MQKPQLYLLKPGFGDKADQFCPDCALVMGYFSYLPELLEQVELHLIDFERPRAELVELLGEDLQNSPSLVFAQGEQPEGASVSSITGRAYINDGRAICRWFGLNYNGFMCDA